MFAVPGPPFAWRVAVALPLAVCLLTEGLPTLPRSVANSTYVPSWMWPEPEVSAPMEFFVRSC